MTARELILDSIAEAKAEPELPWSDAERLMWVGYVTAVADLGLLTPDDYVEVLKALHASEAEHEMARYIMATDLTPAADLVRLERVEVATGRPDRLNLRPQGATAGAARGL